MSATKQKPIKVKVGNVTVKIYRVQTHGCDSFQVADYSSGKRKLISFSDEEKARTKATEIASKLVNGEGEALSLTSKDSKSYVRALDLLKPSGTPLEVAALHYAEAVKILGSDLVIEAAKYYAKRHSRNLQPKMVKEVFNELVEDAKTRKLSVRYIEDLNGRCGRFAREFGMPIASVSSADIRQFLTNLKLSPRSHNNYLGAINRLFEFAKERNYLPRDHDEMSAVGLVKEAAGEIEVFTPGEMNRLMVVASEDFLPVLALGAFAGLRSAEIERLDWSEVNLAERFIKITAEKGKTASRRIVPIVDNLAAWLAPYSKRTGKVWPHTHAYLHEMMRNTAEATEIKENKEKGLKALAAVEWKHNALRHSFISYRLAKIQNAAQVALEAGNSPQMIFKHYRELVRPADAEKWFSIVPEQPANVIQVEAKKAA